MMLSFFWRDFRVLSENNRCMDRLGGICLEIEVLEKEEIKVVGISWNGTYSQMNTIPELY